MNFNFEGKKRHNKNSLVIYNTKGNEPCSSVMESGDYDFAIQKYPESDFRCKFVQEYIKHIEFTYGIKIYNCKFERPQSDGKFMNFYIYLWEDDPTVNYRIEDSNHFYAKAFYNILNENSLPAVTKELPIQILLKNICRVMHGRVLDLTWHDIHIRIKEMFPEIADLSYWSDFYVFIKKDEYEKVVKATSRMDQIKEYCYKSATKNDVHHILNFDQFHIRIDNYENYRSIGGYNYFNSDFMFNCLLY